VISWLKNEMLPLNKINVCKQHWHRYVDHWPLNFVTTDCTWKRKSLFASHNFSRCKSNKYVDLTSGINTRLLTNDNSKYSMKFDKVMKNAPIASTYISQFRTLIAQQWNEISDSNDL
jgi:hypothetical protein